MAIMAIETKDIIKKLKEKSQELSKGLMYEWIRFIKKEIYIKMTPDGFVDGRKKPKKAFYKIGKKYMAWKTSPGLSFDFIGEVICIKSWWETMYEYEGEAGGVIGHRPWGQFKTQDGETLNYSHQFITTIEIKNAVDKAIEDYLFEGLKDD